MFTDGAITVDMFTGDFHTTPIVNSRVYLPSHPMEVHSILL
jgi:hypothetical protein